MCGIFALLNIMSCFIDKDFIKRQFEKGKGRGPDDSNILDLYIINCMLGFHRLAINGLNDKSNQPFYIENIFLVCNGEIYNYRELYKMLDVEPTTDSDCEIIIYLYIYRTPLIFNNCCINERKTNTYCLFDKLLYACMHLFIVSFTVWKRPYNNHTNHYSK